MKKILFIFLLLSIMFVGTTKAVTSERFEIMISIMNIPKENINGYEINEEIYDKYSLIVYGTPKDVTKNQRWKDVKNGKWINEKTGNRGEYRILGYSLTRHSSKQ